MCATIMLDNSGSELVTRIGNQIYNECRTQRLSIPNFPAFDPVLAGLKSGYATTRDQSFRVSAQRGENLLILESLARKWTESDVTREEAEKIITQHNHEYNSSEDYWLLEMWGFQKTNHTKKW